MAWTERQHALLRGIGLRVWAAPVPEAVDGSPDDAPTVAPVQSQRQPQLPRPTPAPRPIAAPPMRAGLPDAPAVSAEPAAVPMAAPAAAITDAATTAALQMDWPALRAAVAGCSACDLSRSRRQTVFGVGHPQAHCMVVGEAPGEQEDRQGEPFVGPAGQLLDRMLAAIGLARAGDDPARTVFICNTLKCRPPGNRNPSPAELACCAPYLQRQVELVQPRVILALGRFAVQALLQSAEPLGRLRGRVHRWGERPLVVSYHPAYLLRQPADKARAWADLCLAADLLQRGG